MSGPPTGTVTFLFTDIEGSTKLAQQYPAQWEAARQRHNAILREAITARDGYVFQVIGDAFCTAFHNVSDAIAASVTAQRGLQAENWGETAIRVRIGLHTGAAEFRDGEYHGYLTLTQVQRVMSTAFGSQTLVSNATVALLSGQLPDGVTLRDMGEHRLKGLLNPEHLWQLVAPDLPQDSKNWKGPRFVVLSPNTPHFYYAVDLRSETCTCADFLRYQRPCKHICAVVLTLLAQRRLELMPRTQQRKARAK